MPNSTHISLITLKEAATMSDRTVKTIRNWIKAGKLETTKKDPEKKSSKLLISKEELLALLGSEVTYNPPRKTNVETTKKEGNVSLEILRKELEASKLELEKAKLEVLHKTKIIEILEEVRPSLETLVKSHESTIKSLETRLEETTIELQATKTELTIYKDRYQREVSKGFLERIFSPAKSVKLLTESKDPK